MTFSIEKNLYNTVHLFKVCFFPVSFSVWVSPRKCSLALNLLILRKCAWARCTDCLVLQFSKHFLLMLCMCCILGEEAEKNSSFGGSSPALHRQRWSRGRGCTALVHLLCPTGPWREAHTGSVLLAHFLTQPVQLGQLLRWNVATASVLNTNPNSKCSLTIANCFYDNTHQNEM